jgi:alkanesulfonate monooxygenase
MATSPVSPPHVAAAVSDCDAGCPQSAGLQIFSTCPSSKGADPQTYLQRVIDVARWSEAAGCCGTLVYTDNSLVDPWLVAEAIIRHTEHLAPLVAVQPIYMHPYTAAKMVASLGFLYGRRVCLNMLAGGFRNDLAALGDDTPHDDRYLRTTEYTTIIQRLLEGAAPLSFHGRFYHVEQLRMTPPLPAHLRPGIYISGSSDAGLQAARALGATAIKYPKPPRDEPGALGETIPCGVRVGLIARESAAEAWRVAQQRFPEDRTGQLAHALAMKVSDSHWHHQLSQRGTHDDDGTYWLGPFHNYQTFCPYLVGSYHRVAAEVAAYVRLGYRTFVLDIPPSEEELWHAQAVFQLAQEQLP